MVPQNLNRKTLLYCNEINKKCNVPFNDAETCGITELADVAKTYRHWAKGILNAFKYDLSNGTTEGFNNKVKVLKRTSYGIKNFDRFRTRILHITN